jgi:hypothetical protein
MIRAAQTENEEIPPALPHASSLDDEHSSVDNDIQTVQTDSIFTTASRTTATTTRVNECVADKTEQPVAPLMHNFAIQEDARMVIEELVPMAHVLMQPVRAIASSTTNTTTAHYLGDAATVGSQTVSTLSTTTHHYENVANIESMHFPSRFDAAVERDWNQSTMKDEAVAAPHGALNKVSVPMFWKRSGPIVSASRENAVTVRAPSLSDQQYSNRSQSNNDDDANSGPVLSGYSAGDDSSYSYSLAAAVSVTVEAATSGDRDEQLKDAATSQVSTQSVASSSCSHDASSHNHHHPYNNHYHNTTSLSSWGYRAASAANRGGSRTTDLTVDSHYGETPSVKTSLSRMQMMAAANPPNLLSGGCRTTGPQQNGRVVDLDTTVDDTTTSTAYTAIHASQCSTVQSYRECPTSPPTKASTAGSGSGSRGESCTSSPPTMLLSEPVVVVVTADVDNAMRRGTSMAYHADQSVMGTKDEHTIETGSQKETFGWPNAVTTTTTNTATTTNTRTSTKSASSSCGGVKDDTSSSALKPLKPRHRRCCVVWVVSVLLVLIFAAVAVGAVLVLWKLR